MTAVSLLAAALAAVTVAIWVGPNPSHLVRRTRSGRPRAPRPRRGVDRGRVLRLAVAGVACVTATAVLQGRLNLVVLALVAVFVGWAALTLRARSQQATARRGRLAECIEACDMLAADLDTGASPAAALGHAAVDWPMFQSSATAARLGGDVPATLRTTARTPGCEPLAHLAAAWQVSTRSGAALTDVLDRMSSTLRDEQEARREVTASLGSPRATARLLAVLPLVGLGLGTGLGGDPWHVLTGSLLGACCLGIGAVLAVTGVFWVDRIAERCESAP